VVHESFGGEAQWSQRAVTLGTPFALSFFPRESVSRSRSRACGFALSETSERQDAHCGLNPVYSTRVSFGGGSGSVVS
jgi:hypothetical protein